MSDRSAAALLIRLRGLDVRVWAEGDRLRCSAPRGVLTEQLTTELGARKAEVLALLRTPPSEPAGDEMPETAHAPLSFSQQRLWFLDQLDPGSAEYNIAGATQLTGQLDVDAMKRAIAEIVRRHGSLRTVFAALDGAPVQVIGPPGPAMLPLHDLRDVPRVERESRLRRLLQDEARRPFDLKQGPLFRATLYRTDDEEHLLMATTHHIVADGWSSGVFVRELCALYEAFVAGDSSPLAPLPIQFADFARWEQKRLQGETMEQELTYWTRRLEGYPPFLELPTDRPRPPIRTHNGTVLKTELPPRLSGALAALSRREGVTLFMTLLAAFDVFLWRYTGQTDILAGTPVANRTRRDTEGLIGLFANTLVLRTDLSGDPTVRDLLGRVRDVALGAYGHQDVPFAKLVEALNPERAPARSPLVQVLFGLQNVPPAEFTVSGLRVAPMAIDTGTAKFDLSVTAIETGAGVQLWWEYNTDLFDAATVGRMSESLEAILEGIAANPDAPIGDVPAMSSTDRERLVHDWNATGRDYPRDARVHELIERQARRTPDRVAVEDDGGRLTYAELDHRADAVAAQLQALGIGAGALVGLYLERSIDAVAALIGVLKAGAAYVPMDPSYPSERLSFVGQDAGLSALLTSRELRGQAPAGPWRIVTLEAGSRARRQRTDEAVLDRPDLAYVIYTSGSTGTPKGVAIRHTSVVNLLTSMQREPGLTGKDVLLAVTTLSFDIAVLELLLPLTVGARVVIASRAAGMDGGALASLIAESGATVMQATPATWQMLVESGWSGTPGLKVLCGGEAMPPDLATALLERAGEVWNMYGPTETTIWSSVERVQRGAPPTIGRPIANTQMYVLDGQRRPLPIGVAGELYIGGDGLASAYWNRPGLTAERFVPDPFGGREGARLYRTGDRARYRSDGRIECLGRADDQIKLRGFRIEPGEIEAALRAHPGIRDAAVAAQPDAIGSTRLVAYVVASGASAVQPEDLRATLRAILPEYMVPSAFVPLEALPRTSNGKIDRRALLAAETARVETSADDPGRRPAGYAPPGNDVERLMAEIWGEVLGLDRVGVFDSFFELGGHSLSAARLVARLRTAFHVDLPVQSVFVEPTIRDLSRRFVYDAGTGAYRYVSEFPAWKSLVPVQPRGTRPPLFLVVGYTSQDETTLIASRLIPHLGLEQPIYGIRPRWLDGSSRPYESVEEMARECLDEIRSVQPSGPYRLGGLCVAGSVALEIAQLLKQRGEEVSLLALIDAGRPCALRSWLAGTVHAWHRGCHIAGVVRRFLQPETGDRWRRALRTIKRKLGACDSIDNGRQSHRWLNRSVEHHGKVMLDYRARTYQGDMILIVSDEYYRVNRYMGWNRIAKEGVALHQLPGDHQMLLAGHIGTVAQLLREGFDEELRTEPARPERAAVAAF